MLTIIPQPSSSSLAGITKTALVATRPALTHSKLTLGNITGGIMCYTATPGEYLMLAFKTTSAYITAYIYNSDDDLVTTLTVSGALVETVSYAHQCALTYSTEQSKWYLLSGNGTVAKIYPLSLSGTTLTVGTAIDASSEFTGKGDDLLMTGDKTDLYVFDLTDGVFKKYDTSAGTWGSALTAPTTGYAGTGYSDYCNFHYSDGNIYFLSSNDTNGIHNYFYAYNISGDSWSDQGKVKGITQPLGSQQSRLCMVVDPDDDTYIYFYTGFYNVAPQTKLVRWEPSTGEAKHIIYGSKLNALFYASGQTPHGLTAMQTNYYLKDLCALDISNGDIITPAYYTGVLANWGTNYALKEIFSYTGSGNLLGFADLLLAYSLSAGNEGASNRMIKFYVTIDGGVEYEFDINSAPNNTLLNSFILPFSTSISVKSLMPTAYDYNSSARTLSTVLLNIIS